MIQGGACRARERFWLLPCGWISQSGARAGYDGAKRRNGSKAHIAVDTLGHLPALKVTAASAGDREQVAALAAEVQEVTGSTVELAYVGQSHTGSNVATGSWNAASPGPPASEGSQQTTIGSIAHSKASTMSPSPSLCLQDSSGQQCRAPDSL